MRNALRDMAEWLGLRRAGAAAPPLDQRPVGSMALWGIGLGLILGLPLALVLHHPWSLLPWSVVISGLLYLGRDPEPLPRDLGLPERPEKPNLPASELPESPEPKPLVELVDIPAGHFRMGSPWYERGKFGDERPRHRVQVPAFRMMRTMVTRRLYRTYMDQVPEAWGTAEADGELPANWISWHDAGRFCNALSAAEGLEPCYRIEGEDSVELIPEADGYRLPTEAEWEYACRAGTTTAWSFGANASAIGNHAWYEDNAGSKPHPVAEKEPNNWGLHDMHGNLWEWVEDCWHKDYRGAPGDGSAWLDKGVDKDCSERVVRGGSFVDPPGRLRSAIRVRVRPGAWVDGLGFRCVRSRSPGMGPSPS